MANVKTPVDTIALTDLEDGSTLRVHVEACTEVGNDGVPGLQVLFLGYIVCFEPRQAARWAYQAKKANQDALLLDSSWTAHTDQYVKVWLVRGTPGKARVAVKTRTAAEVVREYPLPFAADA